MKSRLLLASMQIPGLGGSSTASYDLFTRLLRDGRDVHYVNLIIEDPAYLAVMFGEELGNPNRLPNVHNCWVEGSEGDQQAGLKAVCESIDADVVLGFGFPAAMMVKRSVPRARTVLMTGSCRQASVYVTTGRATSAVDLARRLPSMQWPPVLAHAERLAVEKCDLTVTHSASTLAFMTAFFPARIGKIYPDYISYAEWITEGAAPFRSLARPFDERDIDVLFVANDWKRKEKNFDLAAKLARRLTGLGIHMVGDAPRALRGVVHHGFVPGRRELFDLLGRTRCVVSPSRIDAAPGILFEGSAMGCNLVASLNCGNADMCHRDLIPGSLAPEAFEDCIRAAVREKHEDNLGYYLERGGYAELLATLEAFANPLVSRGAA